MDSRLADITQETLTPIVRHALNQPMAYTATGYGDEPLWWSLTTFPVGARIDPGTGEVSWTPAVAGEHEFVIELRNDAGADTLSFTLLVQ